MCVCVCLLKLCQFQSNLNGNVFLCVSASGTERLYNFLLMAFFLSLLSTALFSSLVLYDDTPKEKKRNIMDNGNSLFAFVHL